MVDDLQSDFIRTNLFLLSFSTSAFLIVLGLILQLLQISTWITLISLVIILVGGVQVIVDLGWISMIKMNSNLASYKEAYTIVAGQRTQKIFLVPFLFDISFIILSLAVFFYVLG